MLSVRLPGGSGQVHILPTIWNQLVPQMFREHNTGNRCPCIECNDEPVLLPVYAPKHPLHLKQDTGDILGSAVIQNITDNFLPVIQYWFLAVGGSCVDLWGRLVPATLSQLHSTIQPGSTLASASASASASGTALEWCTATVGAGAH